MPETDFQATINQLAALFRSEQPTRPVLLLGAGASFPSGVPTASELVKEIVRLGCAIDKFGDERRIMHVTPTDTKAYCQRQYWWDPEANCGLLSLRDRVDSDPPERRRRH